jgi:hypothetical protein
MPLSSVVGAQSIVKPGVCTSSTRPASPYDGQVIYETDTDNTLVYNGTGWVFLSTSRANPSGFDLVKAETALSSTSVVANNVFSSTYSNYRIMLRYTTTGNNAIYARLRVGGTSNSSTNYNSQMLAAVSTSPSSVLVTGDTGIQLTTASNGDFKSSATVEVFSPAVAEPTNFQIMNNPSLSGYTSLRYYSWMGNHNVATAYDGIEFYCTGTMAGTYTIYGYAK